MVGLSFTAADPAAPAQVRASCSLLRPMRREPREPGPRPGLLSVMPLAMPPTGLGQPIEAAVPDPEPGAHRSAGRSERGRSEYGRSERGRSEYGRSERGRSEPRALRARPPGGSGNWTPKIFPPPGPRPADPGMRRAMLAAAAAGALIVMAGAGGLLHKLTAAAAADPGRTATAWRPRARAARRPALRPPRRATFRHPSTPSRARPAFRGAGLSPAPIGLLPVPPPTQTPHPGRSPSPSPAHHSKSPTPSPTHHSKSPTPTPTPDSDPDPDTDPHADTHADPHADADTLLDADPAGGPGIAKSWPGGTPSPAARG